MNRKSVRNLLKTVSAIAALCIVALLCASCDSTSSSKYVTAIAFPSENRLEIPICSRVNSEDLRLCGGQEFYGNKSVEKLKEKIEAMNVCDEISCVDSNRTVIVLKSKNDGYTDYYCIQKKSDGSFKAEYICRGMGAYITDGEKTVTAPLPIHLITDERIAQKLDIRLVSGADYEYGGVLDSKSDSVPIEDITAQFVEFYKEIGCTVTAADGEYSITLPSGEVTFSLSFKTHADKAFFEVDI